MMPHRLLPLLATLLLAVTSRLASQATDAVIVGVVRDSAGRPLADAEIEARDAATGVRVRVRTGAAGRFALLQLPLSDRWQVTARRIGFAPAERDAIRLRLGDRVEVVFTLTPVAVTLEELSGFASAENDARQGRLGGNTRVDSAALAALPTPSRNFTDFAALSPLSGAQQSLGGQRYTATDVRLDGLQAKNLLRAGEYGAGPFTVSLEAIREFEVNTSVYDVAQGRAGGGTISAVTRAGSNAWTASAATYHRNDALGAARDFLGRGRDVRDFAVTQFAGSVSGPLRRDRAHLLVAFDRQQSDEPLFTGFLPSAADERAAGVAQDSLSRLLAILQQQYGLSAARPQLGRLERRPVATTALARLDWALGARHRLTLRHNVSAWRNPLGGGVDQQITLREARSDVRSVEHQALASLQSAVGATAQHELSIGFSSSVRQLTPLLEVPRGFVRIQSRFADGGTGETRVQFGGNRLAPDDSREWQVQWRQRLFAQRGAVLLSAGFDHSLARLSTFIAESQSGLYEFNSLADLEAGRPNRFSRTVPLVPRPTSRQTVLELGAHVQAEWRPADRWTVTGGVRWDASAFLSTPSANPLVAAALGLRTDRRPADWLSLQPRAQLVWRSAEGRDVVRVGGGLFTSQLPYYAHANSLLYTGLSLTELDLRSGIPAPDYGRFRADPGAIPGLPDGSPPPPALVNLVSPDVRVPTTWKASAAYRRSVRPWLALTGSVFASRTTGNYYYVDRNLVEQPAFRLANEGDRPVFVPAATIDALGRTNVREALRQPSLSRVIELQSIGAGTQRALTLEGEARLPAGGFLTAAYTWHEARDNSTYGCCLARTATTWTAIAGDPRDLSGSWGPSDLDFRHKVVVAVAAPRLFGVQLSGRYVGQSGRRFSLVVNTDINGDEAAGNDLAFLFDPNDPATPPAVAAAFRRILADPTNVARDYIAANLGRLSSRNAIAAPWNGRLDLRLSTLLRLPGRSRVELTADCFNVLNLLNSRWGGQYPLPAGISAQNPVLQRLPLLNVTGFDQATRQYRYTVNESAGVLQRQGDPYTIQLGVRAGF